MVSDCVIVLDQRSTIRWRRADCVSSSTADGARHQRIPVLDRRAGHVGLPITSLGLKHEVSKRPDLDGSAGARCDVGGKGFYRGTRCWCRARREAGKTSIAAPLRQCQLPPRRAVFVFAYEESEAQVVRNMRSVGLDLRPWIDQGSAPDPFREAVEPRARDAPGGEFTSWSPASPEGDRHGSDQQPDRGGDDERDQRDARTADRLLQGERHHRDVHPASPRRATTSSSPRPAYRR